MTESKEDDPHDEVTHWVGNLPQESNDSGKRTDKRNTRRSKQSNVQRQESSVAERGKA
jgi:hypothetical protein